MFEGRDGWGLWKEGGLPDKGLYLAGFAAAAFIDAKHFVGERLTGLRGKFASNGSAKPSVERVPELEI